MEIYNTLSNKYDNLFLDTLKSFIEEIKNTQYFEKDYVTFYPSFGVKRNETVDFILYGQAVNGWGTWLENIPTINDVFIAKQFSNKYPTNSNYTPLDWVNICWSNDEFAYFLKTNPEVVNFFTNGVGNNSYKTYRSFFWNVVFKTISDFYNLERGSSEWAKKVVWSNLYKIAPDGANPNEFEKEIQLTCSVELFKQELLELKPKYAILLTNESWWLPFKKKLNTICYTPPNHFNHITNFEIFNDTKIIVTTRPRFGNGEAHVKEILEAIRSL